MSELTAFTTVSTADEVREIFELQAANLPAALRDAARLRAVRAHLASAVGHRGGRPERAIAPSARARAGFQTLHVYPDATTGEKWHVIVLDLGAPSSSAR